MGQNICVLKTTSHVGVGDEAVAVVGRHRRRQKDAARSGFAVLCWCVLFHSFKVFIKLSLSLLQLLFLCCPLVVLVRDVLFSGSS